MRKIAYSYKISTLGETDDYYKYTFNGWKLFTGKFHADHLFRYIPEYAVITPAMTDARSVHKMLDAQGRTQCDPDFGQDQPEGVPVITTCEPLFKIRGNNIQRCGDWLVSNDGTADTAGHYVIFNVNAGNCGLFSEGFGKVTVSCIACWAILKTYNSDGTTLVEIFGRGGIEPIWSAVLSAGQTFSVYDLQKQYRRGTGTGNLYMYIRQGAQVAILCCDSYLGSWTTPTSLNPSRITASVLLQRFAGISDGSGQVQVFEGCGLVFSGCGVTGGVPGGYLWGIAGSFVRTCMNTGSVVDSTVATLLWAVLAAILPE